MKAALKRGLFSPLTIKGAYSSQIRKRGLKLQI